MSTAEKTHADLEWPALLDALAHYCTSRVAADRARALEPDETPQGARARMRRTAEAMDLLTRGEPVPAEGVVELGDVLERLERGGVATASELHGVRTLLHAAHALRRYGGARRATHPAIADALSSDPSLDRAMNALDYALEPDGGLADRASADLAHARRKANDARQRVIARLEELIHRYADVLQDRYYTVRDGRYVLPVRSDTHIKVPGIVLGSSASGHTLFIEPRPVTGLGNQLKVAQADVEREEARVLADLSDRLRPYVDEVRRAYEACVGADLLAAVARFGEALRAVPIELAEERVLELRAARHPLLVLSGVEVVSNDLSVSGGSVLVVSGPNAGGKTVALKCLGLAALMVRAGLPLPVADGSRVGWFDPVLTDVGDDQSIARSLSTFSAHVTNLAEILSTAREGTLVLLDELAGGTDPEEGAALAAAVLDHLAAHGAAVAVTTHYELLKTLALRDARFVNASVGFDLAKMLPTFTVTLGIPGASSALAVARRYGVPDRVIDRARELLPEHSVGREDVLRRIQDEQLAAQLARRAVEEEAQQVARLRTELETERNLARAREQARAQKELADLLASVRRARDEVRQAEVRVKRKRANEQDVKTAERALDMVAAQVSLQGPIAQAARALATPSASSEGPARRVARDEEIKPGARVYVARIGSTVEVLDATSRGQVRVAAGPLKLFVARDEVLIDEAAPGANDAEKTAANAGSKGSAGLRRVTGPAAPAAPVPAGRVLVRTDGNTVDVRGMRADDALSMVDAFLDRVAGDNGGVGFVLHGHGTGALKSAVREHLKRSPHVASSRAADPEDGGDAFTVFELRE